MGCGSSRAVAAGDLQSDSLLKNTPKIDSKQTSTPTQKDNEKQKPAPLNENENENQKHPTQLNICDKETADHHSSYLQTKSVLVGINDNQKTEAVKIFKESTQPNSEKDIQKQSNYEPNLVATKSDSEAFYSGHSSNNIKMQESQTSANGSSAEEYRKEAKEILGKLRNMKLTLEDLPYNFDVAASLRELYRKTRYDISEEFCKTELCDYLNELHWAAHIRDVYRDLYKAFPEAFEGPSDPEEVSIPVIGKTAITTLGVTLKGEFTQK